MAASDLFALSHRIRGFYVEEFDIYQQYHQNKTNKLIHALTVPILWFTISMLLCLLNLERTLALIHFLGVCSISFLGCFVGLFFFLLTVLARMSLDILGPVNTFSLAVIFHAIAWFVQIYIGHHKVEKNSTSLSDHASVQGALFSLLLSWDLNGVSSSTPYDANSCS